MSLDVAAGTVIQRSKMHLRLKRNFQMRAGAEWLALLRKHIPDRDEQWVRCCGPSARSMKPIHSNARNAKARCVSSR
ncbi:MAG: hypothetical protein OEW90_02065 [Betaproteobacteria bacterium]|nr:hypothetical protein [Betaproteobacteria bacterium]MDH5212447.1 hypothetical protein [Betaproteobacteria bacterium]